MRRASRDYTKYLRGSEEMGGAGAPHEGPLHAPPPPAAPAAAAASRSTFVALLGLGLGQVVCSVALFLYFRAQPGPADALRLGSPGVVRLNFPRRDRIGRSPLLETITPFSPLLYPPWSKE
ncbi:hypothetical protein K5549_005369 [Capra hircus]|nr:hypothetical protein K5549_005369 [Capra hircus]